MGKIALSQNISLDGVMQSPGPTDVPFKYRGWAVDFNFKLSGRGRARAGAERRGAPARPGHLRGHAGLLAHCGR
jgi:hypothetical protein